MNQQLPSSAAWSIPLVVEVSRSADASRFHPGFEARSAVGVSPTSCAEDRPHPDGREGVSLSADFSPVVEGVEVVDEIG